MLARGAESWLALLQPRSQDVAMGAMDGTEEGGKLASTHAFEPVLKDYADVFEPPGMPA